MPDFVRVVNKDDAPFRYHHLNVKKVIKPLGETMMPWDLACTLFGDPFAVNEPKKPDRTASIARCRSNFNYELGMETMDAFNQRRPHLECYDMETQQRIYMLLEDPDGEHTAEFVPPDADSLDQIGLLQRQVQTLTDQLGILISQRTGQAPETPTGQTVTASTDGPQLDTVPSATGKAEFVDGNPFHQRDEDVLTDPLFDFAALSAAGTDEPQDAGVGSADADASDAQPAAKLAPRTPRNRG